MYLHTETLIQSKNHKLFVRRGCCREQTEKQRVTVQVCAPSVYSVIHSKTGDIHHLKKKKNPNKLRYQL